ncbi:hypothetical protein ACH5RR_008499 [Cinchona calisaya]|uniref:Reverse transcriptase n=1 Tax=Cinchona calisaya TaxID=153742 RepID=A0ABD3AEH2_9GENT
MQEMNFTGSLYTWLGTRNGTTVFKRIYKILVNLAWFKRFASFQVQHLGKELSDHSLLLFGIRSDDRLQRDVEVSQHNFEAEPSISNHEQYHLKQADLLKCLKQEEIFW